MAIVKIYSDPHLGLNRKQHFTSASTKKRDDEATSALLQFVKENPQSLCLGDFFDTANNSEEIILRTLPIAKLTDYILPGNHDIPNRSGAASSYEVLTHLCEGAWPHKEPHVPCVHALNSDATEFLALPHVLSQELFDQQLEIATKRAEAKQAYRVLLLHCNYALGMEVSDSTLVLSRERAAKLLETFHYIFIGHEHTHRVDFDGRLVVVGSWRPTAFDNMDDKYVLVYDTLNGTYEKEFVWAADEKFACVGTSDIDLSKRLCQYYILHADTGMEKAVKMAASLFERGVFGVRLVTEDTATFNAEALEYGDLQTLPRRIYADLKENKPHLLPYWETLHAQAADAG